MNLTYLISPIAEQDIDEIITYIAQENPKVAYDFVDALYDSFDKLAQNPYLGHTREDLTNRLVRGRLNGTMLCFISLNHRLKLFEY